MLAGTGGGKTYFGPWWILAELQRLQEIDPRREFIGLVGAPTHPLIKGAALPALRTLFEDRLKIGKWKTTDEELIINGSISADRPPIKAKIHVRHVGDPHAIEGIHADFAWLDEIDQPNVPLKSFQVFRDRLRQRRGRALLTTTPYHMGWLYRNVYLHSTVRSFGLEKDGWHCYETQEGDQPYLTVQFPNNLNPYYGEEKQATARLEMDDRLFQMRHLAQFVELSGLIYDWSSILRRAPSRLDGKTPIPKGCARYLGVDFGKADPYAAVWVAYDPKQDLYIVYRAWKKKTTMEKAAEEIMAQSYSEHIDGVFADPTAGGRTKAEDFTELNQALIRHRTKIDDRDKYRPCKRQTDYKFYQAFNNIEVGISIVRALGERGRLIIYENGTEALIEEAGQYVWGMQGERHTEDHCLDALRYVLATRERVWMRKYRRHQKEREEKRAPTNSFERDIEEEASEADNVRQEEQSFWLD